MCKKYESRFNVSSKAGFTETGQKGIGEGDMSLLEADETEGGSGGG